MKTVLNTFYETYKDNEFVSPLVTQISWTNHLIIMSKTKTVEEKDFYIELCIRERYSKRELERQINSAYFERYILSTQNISPSVKAFNEKTNNTFLDTYTLEFLNLPEKVSENDLKKAIVKNLKNFILEIGKDFTYVGEEYRVQVGNKDFYLEALDRDVKKSNENPSVGVILCTNKDDEVVEYAMSRNLSPTLVSEYTLKLIDKKLLQQKLHEFHQIADKA